VLSFQKNHNKCHL